MIKDGVTGTADDFIIDVTAGENLAARDAVYINTSDGKAYKCDADDLTKMAFVGFAQEAATTNNPVQIRHWGHLDGFSGLTTNAPYYLSGTAGEITATKPTNFKRIGWAVSATVIKIDHSLTKRVRIFSTPDTVIGSSTTRFDITNPGGTTYRYTWDGTGTDPGLSAANNPVGSSIRFKAQNFNAANNGAFVVTGSGANYVEVTNASGVAENDKTLGTGMASRNADAYIKTAGLRFAEIEVVGGGSSGGNETDSDSNDFAAAGGDAAGYAKKTFQGEELAATTGLAIANPSEDSTFGKVLFGQADGTATGGDINIPGEQGEGGTQRGGNGGSTPLGTGGRGTGSGDTNGGTGTGFGSGGGGGGNSGTPSGSGGAGRQGAIVVTEYY